MKQNISYSLYTILGCILLWSPLSIFSQTEPEKGKRIEILNSDRLTFVKVDTTSIQKLIGNVQLKQDSTLFFCDSAYNYEESNLLEAFNNVRVEMPSGVTLEGDKMIYDGNTRIARVFDNILLADGQVELRTDKLVYYRNESYGEYLEGGELKDSANVLTSINGYYYSQLKKAYFKKEVVLVNPDYTLNTDTLGYNTETEVVDFLAPTEILSEDGDLYTSFGTYATKQQNLKLYSRSTLKDSSYQLTSDTLLFDKAENVGYAMGDVVVSQEDSALKVWGEYGIFDRNTNETMITRDAIAVQYMEDDTLYMLADTLYSRQDSSTQRFFKAHYNVQVFMSDMQGIADSLIYFNDDSLLLLLKDPVIWSDVNQLTGDTIKIHMRDSKADSMWVGSYSFLVAEEDTLGYNQIKGKEMRAKFRDNKLSRLHVIGNSESLYFAKDEEDSYKGMNTAKAQEMLIYFKENEVVKINFKAQPDGTMFPIFQIIQQENKLENMKWRISERPIKPTISEETGLIPQLTPVVTPSTPSVPETPDELPKVEEAGKGE